MDSILNNKSFSYFELESTGEIHIYPGEFTKESGCSIENLSICGGYSKSDYKVKIIKLCLKKESAQKMVKTIDKSLCNLCVDRLYQK